MTEKITIDFFSGSQYYEVKIDGEVVYTTSDRRDAYLFKAELMFIESRKVKPAIMVKGKATT